MTTASFPTPDAPPVLIFSGKGGVGKTTSATAAAIALAKACPNESVALVSTDPAHSVRDAIADAQLPTNLEVIEIDAAAEHDRFMQHHSEALHAIASRGTFLDDDEIRRFLDLSIPGVDELMCFVRIAAWFAEDRADRYIIDTAPTGHALRLLTMPQLLEGWLTAVEALMGKHRYMASVFGSGGDRDSVEDFIDDLTQSFSNVREVWTDDEFTQLVPVFNAEAMSIAETARLIEQLDALGVPTPELILNRLLPAEAIDSLAEQRNRQIEALSQLPEPLTTRDIFVLPYCSDEPRGQQLATFFDTAMNFSDLDTALRSGSGTSLPQVTGVVPAAPNTTPSLTFLAGKGGVGKTTMASALALHTATNRKTLLVSTDPAGSLGDAFDADIGPDPIALASNLDAVQLDADRELDDLKQTYSDELQAFLDSLGVSLAYDAEALEHLLELAPTGIDEVMALVRMIEILDQGGYEAVVLDTAPTGHTIRLLELPEVIQQWLGEILSVLVHYEDVVSLPRVNEKLISLSRGLKKLRALLADQQASRLVAVTIPTHLAVAETERLMAGCQRLGVNFAGLIVNQVTPTGSDELSATINNREAIEVQRLVTAANGTPVAQVQRTTPPRGIDALAALGDALTANTTVRDAA